MIFFELGCISNCLECSSDTTCTKCLESSNYFINPADSTCMACDTSNGKYTEDHTCKSNFFYF